MPEDFSFIPEGFTTITAYTSVNGAQELIDFVQKVFDAPVLKRVPRSDGSLMHAQLRIGNSILMMSDANEQWAANPVNLFVYVPDVEVTYRKALAAGGSSLMEPADQDYGDRMSGVKDPFGNQWWLATPIRKT